MRDLRIRKNKIGIFAGDEHKIISDVMLLGRAFSNVTSNCIRYAKEMVWISVEENGEQLKITIRDDGPGILEDDLPHLFDRFYKGKNGNHGLGLSIAKRSMEYMGGDIAAKSLAGRCHIYDHTAAGLPQLCRRRMDRSVIR